MCDANANAARASCRPMAALKMSVCSWASGVRQCGVGARKRCAECLVAFGKGCLRDAVIDPARHQSGHLGTPVAAGVAQIGQQYARLMLVSPGVVKALEHPADVRVALGSYLVGNTPPVQAHTSLDKAAS